MSENFPESGKITQNKNKNPLDFILYVFTRPNLRNNSFFTHVGYNEIHNVFEDLKIDDKKEEINIMFPERWSNILEQRALVPRLWYYYPNLKKLTITTHSVYIIQCVHRENTLISDNYSDFDDEKYETILTSRYCPYLIKDGLMIV